MENIDWSKAPKGATHYNPMCGDWYKVSGVSADCWSNFKGGWHPAHIWESRKDYCIARPSPPWNGQGLPPVGTVCEMKYCGEWEKTEILCIGVKHVFIRQIAVTGEAFECSLNLSACQFRPIRTPEQIAADERKSVIDDLMRLYIEGASGHIGGIAAIYEAGYRKP